MGKSLDGGWIQKHETDEGLYSRTNSNQQTTDDLELDDDLMKDLRAIRTILDGIPTDIDDSFLESVSVTSRDQRDDSMTLEDTEAEFESQLREILGESGYSEPWSSRDLGKATINTPTTEKVEAEKEEGFLEPPSREDFATVEEYMEADEKWFQDALDYIQS